MPLGLYHFTKMPLGLHVGVATFQTLMNWILHPVADCAVAYINDIVSFSHSWQGYLHHLHRVFQMLRFIAGNGQLTAQLDKVEALLKASIPEDKKGIQLFLGLASYYQCIIPNFAS